MADAMFARWLYLASLAPSAHNSQPWLVQRQGESLSLSLDDAFALKAGDPTGRQNMLGLGAFLENLVIAAATDGFDTQTSVPGLREAAAHLMIHMAFSPARTKPNFAALSPAIEKRHTNRGPYHPTDLPAAHLTTVRGVRSELGTSVTLIVDPEARSRIAALVRKGVYIGLEMKPLRNELEELVSFAREGRPGGLLVEAMRENVNAEHFTNGRDWAHNKLASVEEAAFCERKFREAPALAIVSACGDGPLAWLNAGRTLERTLLTIASLGYAHCICAAPVEIPTLWPLLREEIASQERPQALLRFGIPQHPGLTVASPRRSVTTISTLDMDTQTRCGD